MSSMKCGHAADERLNFLHCPICSDAEIVRLRAALQRIMETSEVSSDPHFVDVVRLARAALANQQQTKPD
jgi:hypothetical protein